MPSMVLNFLAKIKYLLKYSFFVLYIISLSIPFVKAKSPYFRGKKYIKKETPKANKSFGQAFSKVCGVLGRRPESPLASGETLLVVQEGQER